jgi:hypothetical protein
VDYTTRIGDSAGKIAALFTGSPVNAADLVRANPQLGSTTRQGMLTFSSLLPGERLTLPDTWLMGRPGALGHAAYPGAFGPRHGGSGGVWRSVWADPNHALYPATGGASVYGQYYVTSQGELTLGALILATHGDQVVPPGFESAALRNANPMLQGVDPNVSLPAGTRVNVPERWVALLKKAGYSVGNNMGVGQMNGAAANGAVDTTADAPPGGSTPILCPDGTIAPGNDPSRCLSPVTEVSPASAATANEVTSAASTIACPDGEPAPGRDETLCPPPGAPKGAWAQNKHGKWSYEDPAFPGWIYPLEKNEWVHRHARGEYTDRAYVASDGKLSINTLLAAVGQSAKANDAFFVANPNLRNVDPNYPLPSGTIVNVPRAWEGPITQSGLTVNTHASSPGSLGQQPTPPPPTGAARPAPPPATGAARPAPPPPAPPAPTVARPAPPAPTVARPAPPPPTVQPHVTTGWVTAPSGHSWYRNPQYPGYGYDRTSGQWLLETQLDAAYAAGSAAATAQQYSPFGGAVQADTAAQQVYQQAAAQYPQQSYPYGSAPYAGYAPVATGWVQGPRGSWRYLDPRYPNYGYDWGQRRWMRHDELYAAYGG